MPSNDSQPADIVPGTLDMMILTIVADGPEHGYGIARAIRARSNDSILVEEGTLYPALRRLEKRGSLMATSGKTELNRKARFYSLTLSGRTKLQADLQRWRHSAAVLDRVLGSANGATA